MNKNNNCNDNTCRERERDFFNDATSLVTSLLNKDYTECIARVRAFPEEVSTWMVIKSNPDPSKKKSLGSRARYRRLYDKEKHISLKNLYADDDVDDDDVESGDGDQEKTYLLRRLPIHFACSMIPDEKWSDDDKILEDLILLMIETNPSLCKKGDRGGKLAIHEAVQNNVSTPIMESLLCNFPQSIQLCDSYGKTPICIRANRCNARSITLDEDPVYDQLSKGVQYWLDEASDSSVSDIIEVSDHENELKSENKDELSEDSEHRKPLGPGKTFGSRHELMMARSAERKGVDTTKKSAHARTSCDSDPWEVFLKMKTASAKDVSELTVVPSQGEESITLSKTAMAAMGRLKEVGDNVHILSQSAPPSKTASKKQYTSRHRPTSRKTHEKNRKTSPNKTRKKQQKSNDDAETKVLAPTTATTESEKMYYKKYQKLKTYFKQLQNTNHSLAKQMRKMQVEKEEQLHRHKSRTKTTISNLRADLAKLGDEKFVFMAAMEELKNRLDHYEVENDLLRNMYASSRKKTELDGDIHLLSYNRKNGDSQLIIAGAEESCGVKNENDVLMAVAEDEEAYVYTPSVSTNNSTLNNNIGMAAKLKVQAATMKLSDFIASSDNSTVDTSASEYNATSKGSLALTAALKMIALAKEENDDDIQTIASEALAANAKQDAEVRVSEIEPKVYNYLQDENKKLKNEVNEIQQKKDDLEDQVYRLKIALGELSLKRKKSTTKASITALAHTGDRSLDTSVGANSWPKSKSIIGRNDSTGMHDYASAPAVIRGTPFGVDINAMKNGDYTPNTSNIENADDSVSDESSSDYKEAYHALLYALDSSNRYATESFLSKRVRDLEFQLEDTIEEKQNADAILMGLNDRKPVQPVDSSPKNMNESGASLFSRHVLPQLKKEVKWMYVEGV